MSVISITERIVALR